MYIWSTLHPEKHFQPTDAHSLYILMYDIYHTNLHLQTTLSKIDSPKVTASSNCVQDEYWTFQALFSYFLNVRL